MRKIKIFQKKVIIPFIVILVIAVAVTLGIYFYKKNNVKEVSVYSVSDVGMTDFWQDSNQTEGFVKADKTQSVYLSDTQQVDKVLVKEGDTVKKGTPLIKYSTTLTSLELEKKDIDIRKMELQLENAKKELEKIKTYQPGVPIYGNPQQVTPEEPEPTVPETNYINLSKPIPEVPKEMETIPAPLTGSGTSDKPYIYLWADGKEYDKTFIEKLIGRGMTGTTEVYAIFMVRENNDVKGEFKSASKIKFTKKLDEYSFSIIKNYTADEDPLVEHKNDVVVPEEPDINFEDIGPAYSADELKKMILEKEKEISETILNIKVAKSEYKTLESELKDTTVYSNIEGVVKTVLATDDPEIKVKPIIVISGGGGYYITGYIGELSLDQVKPGQKVMAMSYSSGSMVEGEVKEVSNIPLEGYRNFGMGNGNVSYYPFTVFVSEEAAFREGDYVQLTPQTEAENTSSSSLYLMKAFILEENGKYFVYVANEYNKLEKRQIFINGGAYENLKIQSGITENDRVAFPYGKNVKEGATVVDGTLDDLYNY